MFGLGGLVAVIYGAAVAGSEWSWGTLKTAVARGESRTRYMLGTFAAIVVMIAVGLAITFVLGVVLALIGATIAGVSTAGLTDADTLARLPAMAARGWFAVVEQAALGFAIATLARSQLAGIGAGIAFYFGETFATIFLPDIVKYLPFAVARASIDTGAGGGFGGGGGGLQRRAGAGHGARARRRLAGRLAARDRAVHRARRDHGLAQGFRPEIVRSGSRRSRSDAVPVKVSAETDASATRQGHLSRRLHRLP